jgi:crotonobetainyl-CoA:carnitine CoA-transferase CaiB-like acyl-CoA transferase
VTEPQRREPAFGDITVLDLTTHPGGALAAMHLAEFGARVVRVDDVPLSSARDLPLWLYANRNKQRVAAAEGLVTQLLADADVVIVDRAPARLAAEGLSRDELRAHHPRLIHASLPPHGMRGQTSELPADELLLSAWTGVADQQPGATSDHPVAPVVPVLTYEQGALGAAAIAAALFARATTGASSAVTVSGLHAVAALNLTLMVDLPGVFRAFGRDKDGAGSSPMFRMHRCRDGKWIFICALTPRFFIRTLEALDLMDLFVMPGVDGDFRQLLDPQIMPVVTARLAERMATRDSADWERSFDAADVPYATVQSREEWAASQTVTVNRLLHRVHDADLGEMVVPDVPIDLSLTPGSVEWQPATQPTGAATSAPALDAIEGRKLPLDGVVVVDTTKYLAGPFGGLLLQDLGATVIKIEPEGGEEFRAVAGATYSVLNRNKPQVVLDLTAPADRDAFSSLVQRSDVLVENMSRKVVDKLHLDLAQLRAANPGLVHCHIDGWGPGPLEDRPAFDPLLQARSGLMAAQGGLDTPVIQAMSVHDIGTGTLAAFGVAAALYARTRLGVGQQVRAALSRTSIAFQGAEFTTFAGRPASQVGHVDYIGDRPTHCFYNCSDGWVAVGATSDASEAAFAGLTGGRAPQEYCSARTTESVVDACRDAGVPAVRVLARDDVYTNADLAADGFFFTIEDDDLGPIRAVRGFSEWEGVPPSETATMHSSGRDTDTILAALRP